MGKGSANSGASATERVFAALDGFRIEVPSWGFANTGTRFGKFVQAGAATSLEEKFSDAGQVNKLTGASPTVALHVLWDLPNGKGDVPELRRLEKKYGVKSGAVNPNLFQDQEYKYGSIAHPSAEIRKHAVAHLLDSVEIGKALGNKDVSIWLADGSNYPGTQSMHRRIEWLEEALGATHAALGPNQRMLVEYKPFEPAFYHTDIADWGMALSLSRGRWPEGQGAGGHRTPSAGMQHRADCDLAAAPECAGRIPLQRQEVCRRRSDAGIDRPVPAVPHLPRDPGERFAGSEGDRVHDRPEPQPEGQDGGDGAVGGDGAGAVCQGLAGGPQETRQATGFVQPGGGRGDSSAARSGPTCGRW